jgi:hypothetical protein
VTSAPAPTIERVPMRAPFMTMAPMPTSVPSPTRQPCSVTAWPTVTRAPSTSGMPAFRIPITICPSERNDKVRVKADLSPHTYPLNYVGNFGTWKIWNPATGEGGDGAFFPNARLVPNAILDGSSNTLMFSEAKAFTPYARNMSGQPSATPPANVTEVISFINGCPEKKWGATPNDCTGHTEWPDGRVHHCGFTTVLTPNTKVIIEVGGIAHDADGNSQSEGKSATLVGPHRNGKHHAAHLAGDGHPCRRRVFLAGLIELTAVMASSRERCHG